MGRSEVLYKIIRPLIFSLEAEKAHDFVFQILKYSAKLGIGDLLTDKVPNMPVSAMGISFPNPIGLAAGLDKNGDHLDTLGSFGFGFIEIGTVTPKPQHGNPQPRLFRLKSQKALINRLGFNNEGVAAMISNIKNSSYKGILGINIGKNSETPLESAYQDYIFCLQKLYLLADYFTINVSSPNTKDLRNLQKPNYFNNLINKITDARDELSEKHGTRKPLVIKLSPDLEEHEILEITETLKVRKIDGVIATNTTTSRDFSGKLKYSNEVGGLSGAPLFSKSTYVLEKLNAKIGKEAVLIGVGGIMSADDALKKFQAGARLIQLYTGLIYKGPSLLPNISNGILRSCHKI